MTEITFRCAVGPVYANGPTGLPLLTRLFRNQGSYMSTSLWQALFQDAIREFDDAKLPAKISQARSAIQDRVRENLTDPSEHERLDNALQTLQVLDKITARK